VREKKRDAEERKKKKTQQGKLRLKREGTPKKRGQALIGKRRKRISRRKGDPGTYMEEVRKKSSLRRVKRGLRFSGGLRKGNT